MASSTAIRVHLPSPRPSQALAELGEHSVLRDRTDTASGYAPWLSRSPQPFTSSSGRTYPESAARSSCRFRGPWRAAGAESANECCEVSRRPSRRSEVHRGEAHGSPLASGDRVRNDVAVESARSVLLRSSACLSGNLLITKVCSGLVGSQARAGRRRMDRARSFDGVAGGRRPICGADRSESIIGKRGINPYCRAVSACSGTWPRNRNGTSIRVRSADGARARDCQSWSDGAI